MIACGGVDPDEEKPRVQDLVDELGSSSGSEICELLTPEYLDQTSPSGGICTQDSEVSNLAGTTADLAPATVVLGEADAIEHGSLSFDGDTARLALCPGGSCISDVGYYELALERVDGAWQIASTEYHVEDF